MLIVAIRQTLTLLLFVATNYIVCEEGTPKLFRPARKMQFVSEAHKTKFRNNEKSLRKQPLSTTLLNCFVNCRKFEVILY